MSVRNHFCSKAFALITGLAFLNMSFFLSEVAALQLEKGELLHNIASLILNSGFEEERDGEYGGENTLKVALALQQIHINGLSSLLISTQTNVRLVNRYQHADHSLRFSPPPDFL